MIFLWTIRHTGTWTILDWLLRHEDIDGFVQIERLDHALEGIEMTHQVSQERQLVERFGGSKSVILGHLEAGMVHQAKMALALNLPTVIPVRDPLAAALTAQGRLEQSGRGAAGAEHLVAWPALLKFLEAASPSAWPALIPIDLDPEGRLERLEAADRILGLRDREASARFVLDWPTLNTIGEYDYKRLYQERDAQGLQERLPRLWSALGRLEPDLRPFLEEMLGYRDLIWWSRP